MTDYSDDKDLNDILNHAEDILTEHIGRYESQRFVTLFNEDPLDVFNKCFELGKRKGGIK